MPVHNTHPFLCLLIEQKTKQKNTLQRVRLELCVKKITNAGSYSKFMSLFACVCVSVCVQIANINLKRVNKRMNCFCLVATLQTPANQRLIFQSHEVSPRLQTACAAMTAVPENNRVPKFTAFFYKREGDLVASCSKQRKS